MKTPLKLMLIVHSNVLQFTYALFSLYLLPTITFTEPSSFLFCEFLILQIVMHVHGDTVRDISANRIQNNKNTISNDLAHFDFIKLSIHIGLGELHTRKKTSFNEFFHSLQ